MEGRCTGGPTGGSATLAAVGGWADVSASTVRSAEVPETRVLAGVCGGLAGATGIDVTLVRVAFVVLSLGSGIGILAYALGWLLLPLEGERTSIFSRSVTDRRGLRLVVAIVPALILVQVVAGALHLGFLGSFSWPVFLALAAAILIRRNASEDERVWINDDVLPMLHTDGGRQGRWSLALRIVVGVALGLAGLFALILGHPTGAAFRPIAGSLLVVAAIVVMFGPWWLSLVRDLLAERQARALAEERAQMAAHVHDSVLQTLALIQRSADDPHQVVRLARAQERELRAWLFGAVSLARSADDAATLVEGWTCSSGRWRRTTGHRPGRGGRGLPLGDGVRALLDAAREATVNAPSGPEPPEVSIFCRSREAVRSLLYVRGPGARRSHPTPCPRIARASPVRSAARMARFGGSAAIRSAPGRGAEVQLSVPIGRRADERAPSPEDLPGRRPRHVPGRRPVRAGRGRRAWSGEADEAGCGHRADQRAPPRCGPAGRSPPRGRRAGGARPG